MRSMKESLTLSQGESHLLSGTHQVYKSPIFRKRFAYVNYSSTALEHTTYKTALSQLEELDIHAKQITPFPAAEKYGQRFKDNQLALELAWVKHAPVKIIYGQGTPNPQAPAVYVGGLSMLFQALRKCHEKSGAQPVTIFMNDGQWPIYKQSGFQLHAHGTQYPDYYATYLIKKLVATNSQMFTKPPLEVDYDNLHLPLGKKVFSKPFYHLYRYSQFFFNQVHHDLTSINRIGPNDRALADAVMQSFRHYRELNKHIMATLKKPILVQNGRFYFSHDLDGIMLRFKKWREMGIPVEFMSTSDLRQKSILRVDLAKPIYSFGMFGNEKADIPADGYAKPHLMETACDYAKQAYPVYFDYKQGTLEKVYIDSHTQKPYKIAYKTPAGHLQDMEVSDFQASLGHADVYKDDEEQEPLYRDFTATGVSMNFVLTIPLERLVQRRLGGTDNPDQVKQFILNNGILPSADLYNLHTTIFDQEITTENGAEVVKLYVRTTQGANFNAEPLVANKKDFLNVLYKLHTFYEGEIELVSAGSCTRHTWLENMPRMDGPFLNGQSGVGLSFAAADHNEFVTSAIKKYQP